MNHQEEEIGDLIREARKRLGLSQLGLGQHTTDASGGKRGITREQISRWERGIRVPDRDSRHWLSIALGIPIETLDHAATWTQIQRKLDQLD